VSQFSDDIVAALEDLEAEAGEELTYRRGPHSATFVAVPAESEPLVEQEETGIAIRVRLQDFLFRADRLVLGGVLEKPMRGDRITRHTLATNPEYEVSAPPGTDHFRYRDPQQIYVRVHTHEA
jgi:hypothetical protein